MSTVPLKVNITSALQVVRPFMPLSISHSFNKYFLSNNGVPDCSRCPEYSSDQLKDPIPQKADITVGRLSYQ